jgi:branched-chain amino acid transport system ATP-binding protein
MSALALQDCDVFYGKAQALHHVSIDVAAGEVVSLIGRKGAGKSTLLKAAIGLNAVHSGRRLIGDRDVTALKPHQLGRLGLAFVPENRRIFPNLTVEENLKIATVMGRKGPWSLQRIYQLFPRLQERAAQGGDTLSGGEQQMLAVGRGLLTNPEVLLLDEPTEGLAPLIVDQLIESMRVINAEGIAMLLVEQNLKVPLKLARRQFVIDNGRVVWSGTTAELQADRARIESLISV